MHFTQLIHSINEKRKEIQLVLELSKPLTTDITVKVYDDATSAVSKSSLLHMIALYVPMYVVARIDTYFGNILNANLKEVFIYTAMQVITQQASHKSSYTFKNYLTRHSLTARQLKC